MIKSLWTSVGQGLKLSAGFRKYHRINKTERRTLMMDKFGPPVHRAMRELDRNLFQKDVKLLVAYFPDPRFLGEFVKACKKDILYLPSVKHIVSVEDSKGVLLRADIDDVNTYEEHITEATKAKLNQYGSKVLPYTMHLDYKFWKADDILRAVLPDHLLDEIPTGFAQAGHVAHLNLREEFKPYGSLIGEVILDKNSKIETVVDKLDSIDTKFRTFQMQVLAGRNDLLVEQHESGCRFRFDFSKVYWNSRLNTEHERLIRQFKPGGAVADVFAGVGPFAVPAGKNEVFVLANDLNPESYKYLRENISLNRTGEFVKSFNLDGRDFIRQSPHLLLKWSKDEVYVENRILKRRRVKKAGDSSSETKDVTKSLVPKFFTNYVMNLPDSALTFLDAFIGLYSDVETEVRNLPGFELPTINVHCFEKYSRDEEEPTLEELHRRVHQKIVKLIDHNISIESCKFHLVRRVAPTKPMFCVSFQLPEKVAFKKS